MERYQIILAYDGTEFTGSQRQGRGRTVQGELEKALRTIGWQGKSILLAGRTDSGTHASGQVAAFDLEWGHGLTDLLKALNANLPADIAARDVKLATAKFHPRFDASHRRYCYRLFCQEVRDPLRERYAWRVWPPVADLVPLAAIWPGRHDFAAFGTPPRPGGSTVRRVISARWQAHEDEWSFEIKADAFLYRMVRRLVQVQVAVGQGRLKAQALVDALAEQTPLPAGLAPACGLTLVEVGYDDLVL
jgi:tRNA pseudouridine38-40 synthase